MAKDQFCLRWNNFQSNIITNLDSLKCDEDLVDVTLTCEGSSVKAHKVILSACSSYFRSIFKENPCPHPVVILKGVAFRDISSLINFMYQGEVHIPQDQLSSFLRTAELLQIRGLEDIASPDEISASETILKEQENRNEAPLSLDPCSAPVTSPLLQEPQFPHLHESESLPLNSPVKAPLYESVQPLRPHSSPSVHLGEVQSIPECSSLPGSDNGEADVWEKREELWKATVPKLEPVDEENIVSLEAAEESNNERTSLFNWNTLSDSRTASIEQKWRAFQQEQPPLNSQFVAGAHQDRLTCIQCSMCDKIISNKSNLLKHMRIRHSSVATQERCPLCGKVFKNKYSLKYHCSTYHKQIQ